MVIRELTEKALEDRRESLSEEEERLYTEVGKLSKHVRDIVAKLPKEEHQTLNDYFVKTNAENTRCFVVQPIHTGCKKIYLFLRRIFALNTTTLLKADDKGFERRCMVERAYIKCGSSEKSFRQN